MVRSRMLASPGLLTGMVGVLAVLSSLYVLLQSLSEEMDYSSHGELGFFDCDLVITRSVAPPILNGLNDMPREIVAITSDCPGVENVIPVQVESESASWQDSPNSPAIPVCVLGIDFEDFESLSIIPDAERAQLRSTPNAAMVVYGQGAEQNLPRVGLSGLLVGQQTSILGELKGGSRLSDRTILLVGSPTFHQLFPKRSSDGIQLGLLFTSESANTHEIQSHLQKSLPAGIQIYDRETLPVLNSSFDQKRFAKGLKWGQMACLLLMGIGYSVYVAVKIRKYQVEDAVFNTIGFSGLWLLGNYLRETTALSGLTVAITVPLVWIVQQIGRFGLGALVAWDFRAWIFLVLFNLSLAVVTSLLAIPRIPGIRPKPANLF
ncbi:MAG: hypothetical protein KDA84_08295 [Planctomycetaceae bacterium]|nr:hypothetical protein [Planctomycetaceae bacterium]